MSRRLFAGQLADETAGDDRPRAERLRRLARELVGVVRDGLIRDGQVRIHGFGTFRLSPTRARKGINPQTGEPIEIPAGQRVLFRPARALRDRIEPKWAPAVPLAEPHPSREATLGGVMSEAPAAGAIPGGDEGSYHRPGYFPDRVAAASIAETVVRTSEPPEAYESPTSGSREANLGGTMGDSPSAGRVPVADNLPPTAPGGPAPFGEELARAAANEEQARGSREAELGAGAGSSGGRTAGALAPEDLPPDAQEPDRRGTVPATREGPQAPVSEPGEAGVELPPGSSREAGLGQAGAGSRAAGGLPPEDEEQPGEAVDFDVDAPLREEPRSPAAEPRARTTGEAESGATAAAVQAGEEQPGDEQPRTGASGPERRRWPAALLVLLLLLLIAPLAWWLWLRDETATTPDVAGTGAGDVPAESAAAPEADATQAAAEEAGTDQAAQGGAGAAETDADAGTGAARDTGAGAAEQGTGETRTAAAESAGTAAAEEAPAQPDADAESAAGETAAAEPARDEDPAAAVAEGEETTAAQSAAPEDSAPTADTGGATTEAAAEATGPAADGAETETAAAGTGAAETAAAEAAADEPSGTEAAGAETAATQAAAAETGGMETDAGETAATTGDAAETASTDAAATADTAADTGATRSAAASADSQAAAATTGTGATEATAPWFSGHAYSVRRGDTLWDLSDTHYVNPYYWPHIWNHNEDLADPDVIEIDQRLWLPTLQGEPRSLSAADRRSIAEGYLRLYRLWQSEGAGNANYALVGVRYFDPAVLPAELRNDPSAGRPNDALSAAFAALLEAEFPRDP